MKYFPGLFLLFFIGSYVPAEAQHLNPGFEKEEFIELLKIGSRTTADSAWYGEVPDPE